MRFYCVHSMTRKGDLCEMEKTETITPGPYCGQKGGMRFTGIHLLIEFWQADYMTDATMIRRILTEALEACGATLLSMDLHVFSPNGGVSGVAVLQESHLSIHTWPEYEYAALDIFVCGTIDPYPGIEVLKNGFKPGNFQLMEVKRGLF